MTIERTPEDNARFQENMTDIRKNLPWRDRLPAVHRLIGHIVAYYGDTDAPILKLAQAAVAELDKNGQ